MKSRAMLVWASVIVLPLALLLLWTVGVGATEGAAVVGALTPASGAATAAAIAAYSDTISQYGITWYFDQVYECGQFANGDYWVVGPVTITRITPDFTGTSHGWEANPVTNATHDQGFEAVIPSFDASRVPSLPYVAQPGESIVKVVSVADTTSCRPCLQTAAVLTVVPAPPPDDGATVFRPPYVGSDKPYYSIDDLRTDLLPAYEPVDVDTYQGGVYDPTLDDVYDRFRQVQFEHVGSHSSQFIRPYDNFGWAANGGSSYYGGSVGRDEGVAALRLMVNDPITDRLPALIAYVQYGIDIHHMVLNGQVWPAGGGEQPAHNLAYAFAAILLDDQAMKNSLQNVVANRTFYNDRSVFYNNDGVAVYGHRYDDFATWESRYWGTIMSGGSSGKKTIADPYGYIEGTYTPGHTYIFCCVAQPWKGQALAVQLMPVLKTVWDNPPFLDFADRWVDHGVWTQPDPCAPFDGNPANYGVTYGPDPGNPGECIHDTDSSDGIGRFPDRHGYAQDGGHRGSPFVGAMWDAYRYTYDLSLTGTPGDRRIYLHWDLQAPLPPTATWTIDYDGPVGNQTPPFTVTGATTAYTLTGLTNGSWYTVTLGTQLDPVGCLTETVAVMPTDKFVYLPLVMSGE